MPDVVVTVPMSMWDMWLAEGDLPGQGWTGLESHFNLRGGPDGLIKPDIKPGERVYVVAYGRLRGYAPLVRLEEGTTWTSTRSEQGFALVRRGGAVAVTIDEPVRGFPGWRYRWWAPALERPFPAWRTI